MLVVLVALLGLAVGSFLNVVTYRVPRSESLVTPASHCPSCGTPIRPWHNVPLFGWLFLRGRCASCRAWISVRYPLVELACALLFVALALRLSDLGQLSALAAYLYFGAIGIALALIDLDVQRLPNSIVLPSYPVIAALLTLAAGVHGSWSSLGRAAIGGAILFAFYFALAYAYPAGMGFGDVKLAGLLGAVLAYLSWRVLVVGAFGGFVLGAVAGVVVLATGRGGRKTALPFGPFMIAGALIAIFAGASIADAYSHLGR